MKRDLSLCKRAAYAVLSFLFMGVMGITHLQAQELFNIGNLYYQINADGASVTLVGPVDVAEATGELTIPSTISYGGNDYAVTRIGKNAFISCGSLTGRLTIPNTVICLCENAFLACSGLTELELGNSLDTIGVAAFYGCKGSLLSRWLIAIGFLLACMPTFAQKRTISGYVMDAASKETLIGATVFDKNSGKGCATNSYTRPRR